MSDPTPPPPPPRTGSISPLPVVVVLLLFIVGIAGVGVLFVLPKIAARGSMRIACGSNLGQLWKQQVNYSIQFGGPTKSMPVETGPDFWLKLTRTVPPMQKPGDDIFTCFAKGPPASGGCDYRGPASDVGTAGPGDPVGADKVGNHGGGGNVLLKSGAVVEVDDADAEWREAALKTKP